MIAEGDTLPKRVAAALRIKDAAPGKPVSIGTLKGVSPRQARAGELGAVQPAI
jgi:hypothetical protein